MADIARPHLVGQVGRFGQRGIAELVRHAVLAHGDFDFHAGIVDIAEHFGDAA